MIGDGRTPKSRDLLSHAAIMVSSLQLRSSYESHPIVQC